MRKFTAALLLVVASLVSAPARADGRVAIEVADASDPIVNEALVRVRGELAAMGIAAEVSIGRDAQGSNPTTPVDGTLVVERDGALIRIRASGPAAQEPVVQELDTRASDVTPEVVAVRAVEALRAVLVGYSKPAPPLKPPAPPPPPKPAAPTPGRREKRNEPAPLALNANAFGLWSAPTLEFDAGAKRAGLGAELGVSYARFGFFLGVEASTTLWEPALKDPAGSVELRRSALVARFGRAFALGRSFELWVALGAGAARFSVDGKANAGYVGSSTRETRALGLGSAGVTRWFSHHLGVYFDLDASFASSAPLVIINQRDAATLERPLLQGSLGLVVQTLSLD